MSAQPMPQRGDGVTGCAAPCRLASASGPKISARQAAQSLGPYAKVQLSTARRPGTAGPTERSQRASTGYR